MFRAASVASVLMMAAAPVVAQTTPTQAAQAQDIPSPDKSDVNRIVCKREETIGSRLAAKKVCLTVQEWEDLAKFHRDETENWQRQTPVRQ